MVETHAHLLSNKMKVLSKRLIFRIKIHGIYAQRPYADIKDTIIQDILKFMHSEFEFNSSINNNINYISSNINVSCKNISKKRDKIEDPDILETSNQNLQLSFENPNNIKLQKQISIPNIITISDLAKK